MITEVVSFIIILMLIRIFITKSRERKLLYLCCLSFAFSALIALYVDSPMGGILAIVFFISSTLSSNAIAHTLGKVKL
ncbi:Protein of unknown function DUF2109, membrane [Methanocaldococcus infernus ME]|uniref:Uncharacterized protein n=1 Tax=Methanocaldococcus infernus (strain DSM 11812 / JCM 15783 / ME) TaxID=573063 RepID=D5VTQ4_METIM|nr:DUF2109 domain-containing protein [Methanocaldococcus infernus]ADG13957.1 Protein of unknown function DUF2109, membrane [Methanocaldococcus infernus ME]